MTEAKLLGLGVASPVHGREYYERLWEEYRGLFQSLSIEPIGVVSDEEGVEKIGESLRDADALFIAVLTGGASRYARMLAERAGKDKPIVLLAHGYHNSFASALSAKSRLESDGYKVLLVEALRPSEAVEEAATIARAVRAAVEVRKLRVVHLDAEKLGGEAVEAAKRFGFRVENVSPSELDAMMERVDVREVKRYLSLHMDLGGVDERLAEGPARLAAAAKLAALERGANLVVIDCFPFILRKGFTPCIMMAYLLDEGLIAACEADYRAAILMTMAKVLTGKPGWIANPTHYDPQENTLILSHCTAATSLGSYATLLPHFETGNPYAVHVRIEPGVYTLAALSPDYQRLSYALVEVVESGMFSGGRCRTQVVAKFVDEENPEPFPAKAVSNHHVLIKGDVRTELGIAARLLGIRVEPY